MSSIDDSYSSSDYEKEVEHFEPNDDPNRIIQTVRRSIFETNGMEFVPTFYQWQIHEHFTQRDPETGRFVEHLQGDATIHRRFGKTVGLIKGIYLPWMLELPNTLYLHIFPSLTQGRAAIWNGKGKVTRNPNDHAIPYLELFPKELWKKKNNAEMSLELINGSVYRVMGAFGKDGTPDHMRGLNAQGIGCDEFHAWKRDITSEIFTPMVAQNGGWIFRIGTPKGENFGYKRYIASKAKSETDTRVRTWHLGINDTYYNDLSPIITQEFIDNELASGVDPEVIKQEYFCDFKAVASAAYYKHQLALAEKENRMGHVPHDPRYPVYAFWDLGKNGTNAVWLCQFPDHNRINAIYFDQDPTMSLYDMHVKLVQELDYVVDKHYYPWDGNSSESTGMTKIEYVRSKGMKDEIEVVQRTGSVQNGIEYTRSIFNKVFFDENKCHVGIQHLRDYQKTVNQSTDNYGDPKKNKAVHGADAFRTMGTAYARGEVDVGKGLARHEREQESTVIYRDLEL